MIHTETTAPCFAIETPERGKETIMLMDAKALARHIMRMDFGTETELYLYADADGKWVECAAALRKERWKDTEYYLLGGYGLPVKGINIERGCSLADLTLAVGDALDFFGYGPDVGLVVGYG